MVESEKKRVEGLEAYGAGRWFGGSDDRYLLDRWEEDSSSGRSEANPSMTANPSRSLDLPSNLNSPKQLQSLKQVMCKLQGRILGSIKATEDSVSECYDSFLVSSLNSIVRLPTNRR